MADLTISQVARQAGLRPSAIRYYEAMKVLAPARRVSGQRRYGAATVHRLAVVRRAQEAGFTLEEIRRLFFGFDEKAPVSARWKKIAESKIAELDARMAQIRSMKELLERLQMRCQCMTVEECGAAILRSKLEKRG
jgi:MerR family transcriptional regulator, redox-sensitive transcriptional activator SoxR